MRPELEVGVTRCSRSLKRAPPSDVRGTAGSELSHGYSKGQIVSPHLFFLFFFFSFFFTYRISSPSRIKRIHLLLPPFLFALSHHSRHDYGSETRPSPLFSFNSPPSSSSFGPSNRTRSANSHSWPALLIKACPNHSYSSSAAASPEPQQSSISLNAYQDKAN
jgi:hypothetical protein